MNSYYSYCYCDLLSAAAVAYWEMDYYADYIDADAECHL
jgi:hypothetical protein